MKPYFYIIQHKRTGKYYAGSRYSKKSDPKELLKENGYITSSRLIKTIIHYEGLESFVISKLKIFSNPKQAHDYETRFLKKVDAAKNSRFFNLHNNIFPLGEDIEGKFVSYSSMGGKVTGNMSVINGHLERIRKLVDEEKRIASAIKAMYENKSGFLSLTEEQKKKFSSLGGKIQGTRNAENGHMLKIRKLVDEEKRIASVIKSLKEKNSGCFLDKELHKKSASLGGKVQGKKNSENGHLKNIANKYWEDVKSGKIIRVKRLWYNNGNEERQVSVDDQIPKDFVRGRLKK